MKKILKNSVIILITILLAFAFVQPSFAVGETGEEAKAKGSNVADIVNNVTKNGTALDSNINKVSATVINWIWAISIIISIIVLMVIGIQYIIGGTQAKADYKKSLIPVVVGIVLIVFATTIVKFLFGMGS